MQDWIKDVEYILMPSKGPVKGFERQYELAYECWRSAWEKFRSELGITQKLNADGFRVTDEIGAIFYQGKCVGVHCFTYGSWVSGPFKDLAYFNGWTDLALHKLKKLSPANSLICSQFTVHPEFTGRNQIVRWKEINFIYIFMRYQNSSADVMCGHLNMTRKVQEAAGESFGATVLEPLVHFDYSGTSLESQLVVYEKEKFEEIKDKKEIRPLCDNLWSRLIHLSEYPVIKSNILTFKKAA